MLEDKQIEAIATKMASVIGEHKATFMADRADHFNNVVMVMTMLNLHIFDLLFEHARPQDKEQVAFRFVGTINQALCKMAAEKHGINIS